MSEASACRDDEAPPYQEQQIALRDALAAIRAPSITTADGEILSPEAIAELLDDAVGKGISIAALARSAANDLDGDMARALTLHIHASDLAAAVAQVKGYIGDLETQVKTIADAAEQALGGAMVNSGMAAVEIDTHTAKPKRAGRKVRITDPDALPIDVMVQPPRPKPKPSIELVRAKLLTGQPCPGAEWEDSEPGINITAKRVNR